MFAPSKKAGHMGATDQLCETSQKVLANGVPSTHGGSGAHLLFKVQSRDCPPTVSGEFLSMRPLMLGALGRLDRRNDPRVRRPARGKVVTSSGGVSGGWYLPYRGCPRRRMRVTIWPTMPRHQRVRRCWSNSQHNASRPRQMNGKAA